MEKPMNGTCNGHNGGKKILWLTYIDVNKIRITDQLCKAVISSRILRPMKTLKHSMRFQMFHKTGTAPEKAFKEALYSSD